MSRESCRDSDGRSVFDEREVFGNCRGSLTDAEIEDVLEKYLPVHGPLKSWLLATFESPQPLHR